jgi:hypothetical protein
MILISKGGRACVGLYVLGLAAAASGCGERASPVIARLMQARGLAAELQIRVTNAADAANRAVMADTDESSIAFAHEAEQETQVAARDLAELSRLLRSLEYSDEIALLDEFSSAYAKYRALDGEVLALAVENTNIKAQRLAFGASREAADALRDALTAASGLVPAKTAWQVRALALTATLAVREIQVLQGPHIAASETAVMTELEQQMAAAEANARHALEDAGKLSPEIHSASATIDAGLTRFLTINSQIVGLSRRNSNVRSLALSLGQKRILVAACEGSLRALGERLAKRDFTATR